MLASLARLERLERKLDQLLPDEPPPSNEDAADRGDILDLFDAVNPALVRPRHFASYVARLEQAVGGDLRLVFAAPPQHGKTEVTLAGLVWLFLEHPGKRHAYVTYNQQRANKIARRVRRILSGLGLVVRGTLAQMILPGGGQCLFTSIDGGITGEPVDGLCVIDDPFKNRREAESEQRRSIVLSAYRDAIETRVHPGASIVVMATRWHPQDLSGVLQDDGWEYINLPAIAEGDDPNGREVGEPLFPELWPLDWLATKRSRVGDFTWWALYQGRPRPPGGKVFHEPSWYTRLPQTFSAVYGLDLAYTAKTSADWSICVLVLREDRPHGQEPIFYAVHMDRAQVEAPEFALTLKARHVRRRGLKMIWRASGTERGAAQFLVKAKLPVVVQRPPGDKLVSATPLSATWNGGRFLLPDMEEFPEEAEWVSVVLDRARDFTGMPGGKDDEIDALGNAHDYLDPGRDRPKQTFFTVPHDGRSGGRVI
jgi:phage terminase large subunit-like protein